MFSLEKVCFIKRNKKNVHILLPVYFSVSDSCDFVNFGYV